MPTEYTLENTSRVNLVYMTDVHLAAVPPGRRRDAYADTVLGKMAHCAELAKVVKGVCINGGDLFHIKNPQSPSNALSLINNVVAMLHDFPLGKLFGAIGNHDIKEDRIETLSRQPLGNLIAAKVYEDLTDNPVIFNSADGSVSVSVRALEYSENPDEIIFNAKRFCSDVEHKADYSVLIIHATSNPGGARDNFGSMSVGWDQLESSPYNVILWGHDHTYIPYQQVNGVWHIHQGSLSRAALTSDESERPLITTIVSFSKSGVSIKEQGIPHEPLEAVFKVKDKVLQQVEKLQEVVSFFAEVEDLAASIESDDPKTILETLSADNPEVGRYATDMCGL